VRKSDVFLLYTAAGILALALVFAHASYRGETSMRAQAERAEIVRALGLTDLCIFTEARYTRHPAVSDLHSAFQDHPASLEHFPSGSIVGPPEHLRKVMGRMSDE
jgi:hypothetical protein